MIVGSRVTELYVQIFLVPLIRDLKGFMTSDFRYLENGKEKKGTSEVEHTVNINNIVVSPSARC